MKITDKLASLARDIEYVGVEVEAPPDITELDAQRVKDYPVSEPRPAESERAEFADGLLSRVHEKREHEAAVAYTREQMRRAS